MASFDENGKYVKTNWKAGDKITATKLNKIEESIEAVNDNDISRHVEADARLDALEAKDVAHDKEFTNVKNLIEDAKDAAELGDYEINSRMTFLENELNEGIEEVHNVAGTVDGKIAQGKADMEAMVAEVEADLEGLHAKDGELSEQLARVENKNTINKQIKVNNNEEFLTALKSNLYDKIILNKGENYEINEELTIGISIDGNFSRVIVKKPFKTNSNTRLINIDFNGLNNTNHCILLSGGAYIEKCQFYSFDTAIKQNGICVHTKIIDNVFGYNKNAIVLDCEDDYSCNNFIIEKNYFVKNGNNVDDLSANGTEIENVGYGLLLECGCNRVEVINNVFEYNSFCGILMSLSNNAKTNDSVIVNNYFEGNKITGIMINKTVSVSNCQYNIKDNYYSQRMTTNSDWVNNDIIARGTPSSFYPVLNQKNKSILFSGGTNVVNDEKDNFISIGSSQYLSFSLDRSPSTDLNSYKVLLSYHSKLDTDVELRNGDASTTIKQFTSGEVKESVIVDVKSGMNKYITRKLNDNEFIRIYAFNLLT